jgi:hypothetical protein
VPEPEVQLRLGVVLVGREPIPPHRQCFGILHRLDAKVGICVGQRVLGVRVTPLGRASEGVYILRVCVTLTMLGRGRLRGGLDPDGYGEACNKPATDGHDE